MADIERIIKAIDEFLEKRHQKTTTPVEINPYLEKLGLLNDSDSRPGKPVRELCRKGKIPHAYQIGVNWFIPHSGHISDNSNSISGLKTIINKAQQVVETNSAHKLMPLSNLLLDLIEKKYKNRPNVFFEYKPDWLLSYPSEKVIEKWHQLSKLYAALIENKFELKEKCKELTFKKRTQKQSFDIWISEPYNFAIEFDEEQHFNQFRRITLDYYEKIEIKYPIHLYKELNNGIEIKPGKSGFTRLKSNDPLFPEMLKGEKQDNRIRQRAFRDFLKDLLPIENGFKPTLRIPYQVTNKNIADFTESDLKNVEKYIKNNKLI